MGNDVIDDGGFCVPALLYALLAQRLNVPEELPTGLLPCTAVASAGSGPHLLRVQWLVRLAVLLPVRNEGSTAGVAAGCVRS